MPPVPLDPAAVPDVIVAAAFVIALYRFGLIPAAHATLRLMRDIRSFRAGH